MANKIIVSLLVAVFGILFIKGSIELAEADKKCGERIYESQKQQHKHLGEKVIIDGDTATVLDTDFWCRYVLSNGKKLNEHYFDSK